MQPTLCARVLQNTLRLLAPEDQQAQQPVQVVRIQRQLVQVAPTLQQLVQVAQKQHHLQLVLKLAHLALQHRAQLNVMPLHLQSHRVQLTVLSALELNSAAQSLISGANVSRIPMTK